MTRPIRPTDRVARVVARRAVQTLAALALVALAGAPGLAEAKAPRVSVGGSGYDGSWNVLIVTKAGSCDQAYSSPVQIVGNRVLSNGMASVTGSVGRSGGVAVTQ